MTNTDTADVAATAAQVRPLHAAGGELVRVTVNNEAAAEAVPHIVAQVDVPVIGDFHYNGHLLLTKYPRMAEALAKYRINPGNVGAKRRDENFRTIIEVALAHGKPVRIGVNWGSLDQQLLTELMIERAPVHADAHRLELGLARSTAADGTDGCQRQAGRTARRPGRHHGRDGRIGPALGRARRGVRSGVRPHHPLGQGRPGRRAVRPAWRWHPSVPSAAVDRASP